MKIVTFFLLFFGFRCQVLAQEMSFNVKSLVAAEKAFSARCGEIGISNSFIEYFADDGLIFNPHPISAKSYYQAHNPKGVLSWWPVFVEIAKSGDLGVSSGPWGYRASRNSDSVLAYGYFISVWRKQKDLTWKVEIDMGIDTDKPFKRDTTFFSGRTFEYLTKQNTDLISTDNLYAKVFNVGSYPSFLADYYIFFRDGKFPMTDIDSIQADQNIYEKEMKYTPNTAKISSSDDFGYSYGRFQNKFGEKIMFGNYLKIWKRNSGGEWKIVLDVILNDKK